ncbi:MAG TPA: hypothetical protein VHN16_16880 [Streptosporangiaceae bacterium]|nr:hypothetical protein [Streptosporangiaceae bacterium]
MNATDKQTGVKPTIVLVHGAFADASSWNGVIERLQQQGYTVIAAANPLRALASAGRRTRWRKLPSRTGAPVGLANTNEPERPVVKVAT